MNLLAAVPNFSGPCPGELRLRHTAGTEGAPSRRKQLQMSLLQSSKAVQMLLEKILFLHQIYFCVWEIFLYSTDITTRATPLSSENYG